MLAHVHEFDPDLMKQFGHHVVTVVAPEVGEEADRLALLREEARARGDRSFSWARDGFGSVRFRGQLPIVDAEPLVALVTAVTASLPVTDELGELIPIHRRQADALTQIVGAYAASGQAPTLGGDRPRVVVTISLDALRTGLGMGTLCSSGEALSAGDIRRLACDADIIPAVLGGASQILDLGRGSRLFTGPTRQALALRDQGCVFPGCNAPPTICEGHHIQPVVGRWTHRPGQCGAVVSPPPPDRRTPTHRSSESMASPNRCRRRTGIVATPIRRQTPQTKATPTILPHPDTTTTRRR